MSFVSCDVVEFSFVFFKQKTAYELLISDWSSAVCSSDLPRSCASRWAGARSARWRATVAGRLTVRAGVAWLAVWASPERGTVGEGRCRHRPPSPRRSGSGPRRPCSAGDLPEVGRRKRSEEHTSALQSLIRNSYAGFRL